ncbi:uncharacterized protein LOC143194834 [Rhynchophorus ferrugineus]|uniref:uncharacterized protein LOC143194834 n=1 Tax=Rhynchophorus ferrugineus TaxID=354439 RepID=UPI003FCCC962
MAFIYIFLGTLALMQEIAYITEASIRYQSNSAKIDNELKLRDMRPIYEEEYQKKCSDNICEMPDFYYPKEIIENLLKSPSSIFKTLVNNSKQFPDAVLQSRTPSKEENICRNIDRYRSPIIMRNTNNHWKYIVNVDKHKQWLLTYSCDDSELNYCNKIFKSQCQQLYTKINLMIYENNQLDYDIFWIKSGCKCSCK